MIFVFRQRVSIKGDLSKMVAAYMVEALVARMAMTGKGLYKALACKEPPSFDQVFVICRSLLRCVHALGLDSWLYMQQF